MYIFFMNHVYCEFVNFYIMKIVSQARQARSTSANIPYPVIWDYKPIS